MDELQLADNISRVRARIESSALSCERQSGDISILAVSKTRGAAEVRAAFELGLTAFGENYLQEALDKKAELDDLDIQWHFIGPIQSNKTRAIAENFDWVHSVDRLKIARRLGEQRPPELPPINICLQVNISSEASKSGVAIDELPELLSASAALPGLALRGLMAIPAPAADLPQQRVPFARLRLVLEEAQHRHPELDTLSMGMSGDLEAAIIEGATIVRIGTDIFGARNG